MAVLNYTYRVQRFKSLIARKHYLTEMLDWIENVYAPTHFVSIQLPIECKSSEPRAIRRHSWWICKKLEKALLGRYWSRQFYPFVGFYEHGKESDLIHLHILLSCPERELAEIDEAFAKVKKGYQKTFHTVYPPDIDIEEIFALDSLLSYCTKQMGLSRLEHIQTQNVFISEEYFDCVSSKSKDRLAEFEKKTNL